LFGRKREKYALGACVSPPHTFFVRTRRNPASHSHTVIAAKNSTKKTSRTSLSPSRRTLLTVTVTLMLTVIVLLLMLQ
jgi:hypothetical protein